MLVCVCVCDVEVCYFRAQPSNWLFEVPAEGGRQRESAERSGSHTFRCSHTESPGSHYGGLEGPWCTVETAGPKKLLGNKPSSHPKHPNDAYGTAAVHDLFGGEMCVAVYAVVFFRASAVCDCYEPAFLKRTACWIPTLAALAQFLSTGTAYFRKKEVTAWVSFAKILASIWVFTGSMPLPYL